jgi:hypothetical protein
MQLWNWLFTRPGQREERSASPLKQRVQLQLEVLEGRALPDAGFFGVFQPALANTPAASVEAASAAASSFSHFNGSYSGGYNGKAQGFGITRSVQGPVRFTIQDGTIQITSPGSGTGALKPSGRATIALTSGSVAGARFSGQFEILPSGGVRAEGRWTYSASGVSGSGKWRATRPPSTNLDNVRAILAIALRDHKNLQTTSAHRKVQDLATARHNLLDAANGLAVQRSSYGGAPGGSVMLDVQLLRGMLRLANKYSFRITEIAGGSHGEKSRHYFGVAFDVDTLNGRRINANHPDLEAFKADARRFGATEVKGPGNPGHATHIHIAWPRPR